MTSYLLYIACALAGLAVAARYGLGRRKAPTPPVITLVRTFDVLPGAARVKATRVEPARVEPARVKAARVRAARARDTR